MTSKQAQQYIDQLESTFKPNTNNRENVMALQTVAGPFNKQAAEDTARALGNQFSVYGIERKDDEGYGTDSYDYYVERDDSIIPDRIFGYDVNVLIAKQYR